MSTNVLILCTHNSARSVLSEGMLNHLARKHGKDVRAYQGEMQVSKDTESMAKNQGVEQKDIKSQNEAVRLMYVDAATGLPERAIYGRKDKPESPIYREVYSYPDKLDIKEPDVKK